jgi:primosomal replication protein N
VENRLVLAGRLMKRGPLRHTPAGVPAIDFCILHDSTQMEAGRPRHVECEIAAVALGRMAMSVGALEPPQRLRVEGFLARRGRRDNRLTMHIIGVTTLASRYNETQE